MNARSIAQDIGPRATAFARRMPRPGQAAFFAARLAVSGTAGFLALRVLASALGTAGFVEAAVGPVLLLFVGVGGTVIVCVLIFGVLVKMEASKGEAAEGNPVAKKVGELAKTLALRGGRAARALAWRIGSRAVHLGAAAAGVLILWVGLGRGGLVAASSRTRRPTNPLLGWAHGLIFAASSGRPDPDSSGPASPESGPLRAVIEAAITEALPPELARRWGYRSFTRTFETDTYEFRAIERTAAGYKVLRVAWTGLTDDMRFATREPAAICTAVVDPEPAFLVLFPRHDQPFPSLPATDLRGFIAAQAAHYAASPWAACLGLDHQGSPVWWNLADPSSPPHAVVAGATGSGKTISGPLSIVLQVAQATTPDRFAVAILDSRKREMAHLLSGLPHISNLMIAKDSTETAAWFDGLVAVVRDRQERYAGRPWTASSRDPLLLAVAEEWQAMMAGSKKEDRERIVAATDEIGAIARSVGIRLLICSQKATADILETRILANLPLRVMGRSRPEDYLATLGDRTVSIPSATPGRLAVAGLVGEGVVMIQGLYANERATKDIIAGLRAAYPNARPRQEAPEQPRPSEPYSTERPEPQPARPASDPDAITQRLVSEMSPRTAARMLSDDAGRTRSFPPVTRDSLRDLVASLGLVAPNNEKLGAALLALEGAGVLEARGRSRTLKDRSWPVLSEMLDKAGL